LARRSFKPRSRSDNNSSQQYPLVACRINVLLARNPLTCTNASLAEIDADIDVRSAHAHAAVATRRRIGYLQRGRRTCAVSQLGPFFAPLSTKLQLFQLPSAGRRTGFLGASIPPTCCGNLRLAAEHRYRAFTLALTIPYRVMQRADMEAAGMVYSSRSSRVGTPSNDRLRQVWRWVKG
jgi:hypothetical protein